MIIFYSRTNSKILQFQTVLFINLLLFIISFHYVKFYYLSIYYYFLF